MATGTTEWTQHTDSTPAGMEHAKLTTEWWTVALRGVIAVAFGLVALVWSGRVLGALALIFGMYALADGALAAAAAVRAGKMRRRWWPMAFEGLVGIVIGLIAIVQPAMAGLTLVAFIGAWALLTGLLEIAAAVYLRREIQNEWLLGLAGVLSVLFGVFAIASPATAVAALVWLVGAYALVFGMTLLVLAWRLHTWQSSAAAESLGMHDTTSTNAPESVRRAA